MRRGLAGLVGLTLTAAAIGFAERALSSAPNDQYQFFSPDSGTIFDEKTKLEWSRETFADKTFAEAQTACEALTVDGGGGFRLPTLRELLTLVDEQPHRVYVDAQEVERLIDPNAFPDTRISKPYWSSTPKPDEGSYWTVSFQSGITPSARPDDTRHARCVRAF